MKCRGNQPTMRAFVVRALSFLAVVALTLNPILIPAVASDYRAAARGFASGTPDGLAVWVITSCLALEDGAREALAIAEASSG